jgi:putative copper resistance protein D
MPETDMAHGMGQPEPFAWSHVGSVAFSWAGLAVLVLAGLLYLVGSVRWTSQRPSSPWSGKRTACFMIGLGIVLIATQSVVGVYDMVLFSDHMVQHLLLIMVAAAFFAMSAPLELALATIPGRLGRGLNAAADSKVGELLGHPIVGFALYAVFIPVTHLTSLFNLMLTHMWVHRLEQVGFLVIGYLFWRPVVAIEPSRHRLAPGLRLVYLALAVPVDTFTGLALAMSGHEMFPAYTEMHRTWGGSLISDLHTGGSLMWIGGDLLMMAAMIPIAVLWMRDEELRAKQIDAQLDAEAAAAIDAGLPT